MPSFPSTQNGLVYLGPQSFSVSGDFTNLFKPRRAIAVTAVGVTVYGIYVKAADFSGVVTTVMTSGEELPPNMTGVQLGQDPDNAPRGRSPLMAAMFS